MKSAKLLFMMAVAFTVPAAKASHIGPCEPTSADPASVLTISLAGRTLYDEERGNPFGVPIPMSAFWFGPDANGDGIPEFLEGQGTWIYEETNGLEGLQRGGFCDFGGCWWPPGCDANPDWVPTDGTPPCLILTEDPINDETCNRGPDTIIL